jgi:hypothetical protein
VGSLNAVTELQSDTGNVSVKTGADGHLTIETAAGDIDVQLGMAINHFSAHTATGDVRISAPLKFSASPVRIESEAGVSIDPAFSTQIEYDGKNATGSIGEAYLEVVGTDAARGFVAKTVEIVARAPAGRVEIQTKGWLDSLGLGNMPKFD